MASDKQTFLGRRGKSYGPYSTVQLEEMRLSGELEKFTFRWDETEQGWKPLEKVPPPPGMVGTSPKIAEGTHALEAICHDFNAIVAGLLENVSDLGCDLVARDRSDGPRLGTRSQLVLNVVEPSGKQSVNVKASLSDVVRRDEHWVYRIRWSHPPFPME